MKTILQLSYKYDEFPKEVPVVDCRVINNPYHKNKSERAMMEAVVANPLFPKVVDSGVELLQTVDTIVVACAYGKHRSGTVARTIAKRTGAKIVKGVNNR